MTGNTTTTRARDNGEGEIRERKDASLRLGYASETASDARSTARRRRRSEKG
jgi:hypothetical protein